MMLITRPDYEPGVRYLSAWSLELIEEAKRRDIEVVDLPGEKARRKDVEGRLRKLNPALVILNGHGSDDSVTGQDAEVLIKAHDNSELLKGAITYAVSCESAAVLGVEVGQLGNTAYIGYEKGFVVFISKSHVSRPFTDPLAAPFKEFSNHIVTGLLKGHPAHEVIAKAKTSGIQRVYSLLSSTTDPDAQAAARYLWWDIGCLTCKGDSGKRALA